MNNNKQSLSKKKTVAIIISCILAVGLITTGITLYIIEENRKQDDLNQQQSENELLDSILAQINEFERQFNNANEREQKLQPYADLSSLYDDFENNVFPVHHELIRNQRQASIVNRFNEVFRLKENWFYNHYVELITDVEQQATDITVNWEDYYNKIASDISEINSQFQDIISNDNEDEEIELTQVILEIYNNLIITMKLFLENGFTDDKITDVDNIIENIKDIDSLITQDSIIIDQRLQELSNKSIAIIDNLSLQLQNEDRNNVINQFETLIADIYSWLLNYYLELLNEIANIELLNERETLENKIADLENIKITVENIGILDENDMQEFFDRVDELLEEYNSELEEIIERERLVRQQRQSASTPTTSAPDPHQTQTTTNNVNPMELFHLLNVYREENGLPAFNWNVTLASAAQEHAETIDNGRNFTTSDGINWLDRLKIHGWIRASSGVNVTALSTQDAFSTIANVASERILNPRWTEIGIGAHVIYCSVALGD
ncbi:MAG: CAP domain-containing protein [Oscillospiraceae bacterium]|jgi:uncharacterized protein YkwD|nr:CAP domain-containing protein [Oscillospiraceae bacterium]